MKRRWIYVLTILLSLTVASAEVMALQKSRSSRKSSRTTVKKRASSKKSSRSRKKSTRKKSARSKRKSTPQVRVPEERVTEIQNALIKAGYFDGPASGEYDDATIEAMKKFQADNGLQKTGRPSAHSLKKLGVSKRSDSQYAVPVKKTTDIEKNSAGQSQANAETKH